MNCWHSVQRGCRSILQHASKDNNVHDGRDDSLNSFRFTETRRAFDFKLNKLSVDISSNREIDMQVANNPFSSERSTAENSNPGTRGTQVHPVSDV